MHNLAAIIQKYWMSCCSMLLLLILLLLPMGGAFAFVMPKATAITPICSRSSSVEQHEFILHMASHEQPERLTIQHQDSSSTQQRQQQYLSSATPYNKDIARTLFPRYFFALDRHAKHDNHNNHQQLLHRYPNINRPCPFTNPTSSQTSERMLRRMMENRYQSDGRTVCPNDTTFHLVSGAFGRLRHETKRFQGKLDDDDEGGKAVIVKGITWEEEVKLNPSCRSNAIHDNKYNQIVSLHTNANNDTTTIDNPYRSKVIMTPILKLQELLQLQLQLCHYENWQKDLLPSVHVYNRILKRLGNGNGYNSSNSGDDAVLAWKIFQFMQSTLPDSCSMVCEPNMMTYLHVIRALTMYRPGNVATELSNERPSIGASKTAVLQSMEDLSTELGITMNRAIPEGASIDWFLNEAEQILVVLKGIHEKRQCSSSPQGNDATMVFVQATTLVLERWGKFAVTGNHSPTNTLDSIQLKEYAIVRARDLMCSLEDISKKYYSSSVNNIIPSSSYASVILGLSVSNKREAASQAEHILNRMIVQSKSLPSNFDSEDISTAFSACIATYAKNNDAPNAERILFQMIDLYESKVLGDDFVPNPRAYGTCIAALAKYTPEKTVNAVANVDVQTRFPHSPTWRQRVKNADNAENILVELERLVNSEKDKGNDIEVDATPYNIAIHARVQTVRSINKKDYKNKSQFLNDEANNEDILLHAMSILDHMEYEMKINPDSYTYSILLNAWVQHARPGNEEAADKAEELLRRKIPSVDERENTSKELIWPNVKHYSSVLKAHAKTKSAGGAKKALSLLSEMERHYSNSNVISNEEKYDEDTNTTYYTETRDMAKPDLFCYAIVMDAMANSRLPEAGSVSFRLLLAIESKYQAGDFSMKPNTRICTAVIQSLVYSEFVGSFNDCEDAKNHSWVNNAQVAMHILKKMKASNVSPNVFTYNYIINCAAECKSDDVAEARISFEVALRAFRELRDNATDKEDHHSKPDSFTYAFMLKACSNHLPKGSSLCNEALQHTFKECCRSGHVNAAVLERLYSGLPEKRFSQLTGIIPASSFNDRPDFTLDLLNLPSSWSRNVHVTKYPFRNKNLKRRNDSKLYNI